MLQTFLTVSSMREGGTAKRRCSCCRNTESDDRPLNYVEFHPDAPMLLCFDCIMRFIRVFTEIAYKGDVK